MRKYFLLATALLLFTHLYANDRITYSISRPLCLLTFLQAANGTGSVAPALSTYIKKNLAQNDSAEFYHLVSEFSEIELSLSYVFPYYPEKRQHPKTILNLVTIAAVNSTTVEEFLNRIIGMLPNEQWVKLRRVLNGVAPYYDKMIFHPYESEIDHQLTELRKFNNKADDIFNKLKHFYGSTWEDDMPFMISMYPIPGDHGTTTATPHSNSLVLAVLNVERDYSISTAVAIHEICHVLYEEQPLPLQEKLDSFFLLNKSPYKQYAYNYIDEALATACGNGWSYKLLTGKIYKYSWYNDGYVDGFAHAIYPLTENYIENGRVLDKNFVDSAVILFGQRFPDAIYNYQILLDRINLYTDAENNEQYGHLTSTLYKYFKISSCAGAYPIADPQALAMIDPALNTQLFIVHTNHRKDYDALREKFPQLKNIPEDREGIVNFLDEKKRPIILINVRDFSRLELAVKKLSASSKMDPEKIFIPLE